MTQNFHVTRKSQKVPKLENIVIIEMTVIYINLKLKIYVKKSNTYLSGAGEY